MAEWLVCWTPDRVVQAGFEPWPGELHCVPAQEHNASLHATQVYKWVLVSWRIGT